MRAAPGTIEASAIAAFGLPITTSLKWACGWGFPLGINARIAGSAQTGSAAAPTWSSATRKASIATSANTNSSSVLSTRRSLRYVNGIGGRFLGTCNFATPAAGSSQEFGLGDANDALVFGYNATAFGLNLRAGGVDGWIPASSFSKDKLDGTGPSGMNLATRPTTNLHVYGLSYQYLGGGELRAFMEDSNTGLLFMVHRIQRAGLFVAMSMLNPQIPVRMAVTNGANTSNLIMQSGSSAAFWEGDPDEAMTLFGCVPPVKVAGINTTETPIFTLRNPATVGGVTSRIRSKLNSLRVFGDGTGNNPVTILIRRGATLTGATYAAGAVGADTYSDYDTAATVVSGGTVIYAGFFGRLGQPAPIDLTGLRDCLLPGETATVSMFTSATNFDGTASMSFTEEL